MKTLAVLEYPMLVTKFQGHKPLGYKEDNYSVSLYMGMVMRHGIFEQIFIPHIRWMLHVKFCLNQPSGF